MGDSDKPLDTACTSSTNSQPRKHGKRKEFGKDHDK